MYPSSILRNKIIVSLSCTLFVFGGTACFQQSKGELSSPELSTTTVGAIAGTAVGAGLGAIVGASAGAAGEGVALGAVAGAATGGLVGHKFEEKHEVLANHEERIIQQDEQIKQHRREIERLGGDRGGYSKLPSSQVSSATLYSSARSVVGSREANNSRAMFRIPSYNASSIGSGEAVPNSFAPVANAAVFPELASAEARTRAEERAKLRNEARARLSNTVTFSPPPLGGVGAPSAISRDMVDSGSFSVGPRVEDLPLANSARLAPPAYEVQDLVLAHRSSSTVKRGNLEQESVRATLPTALPTVSPSARDDISKDRELDLEVDNSAAEVFGAEEKRKGTLDSLPAAATYLPASKVVEDKVSSTPKAKKPEAKKNAKTALKETPIEAAKKVRAQAPDTLSGGASECAEGEAEAVRARNATSDADKLFYYRRAIRLCSAEPAYYIEVGRVYSSIGKGAEAKESFHKALELDPENVVAQDELSLMMLDNSY